MKQSKSYFKISITQAVLLSSVYLLPFLSTFLVKNLGLLPESVGAVINTMSIVIQAPLMLIVLVYLNENNKINKLIGLSLTLLLAFTSLAIAMTGVTENNLLMILLIGSIPVFIFSSMIFINFVKHSIQDHKETSKAILMSAIVFAFGSFITLLVMNLTEPQKHANDMFAFLGLVSGISTVLITLTIAFSKKEIKEAPVKQFSPSYHSEKNSWKGIQLANVSEA